MNSSIAAVIPKPPISVSEQRADQVPVLQEELVPTVDEVGGGAIVFITHLQNHSHVSESKG